MHAVILLPPSMYNVTVMYSVTGELRVMHHAWAVIAHAREPGSGHKCKIQWHVTTTSTQEDQLPVKACSLKALDLLRMKCNCCPPLKLHTAHNASGMNLNVSIGHTPHCWPTVAACFNQESACDGNIPARSNVDTIETGMTAQ